MMFVLKCSCLKKDAPDTTKNTRKFKAVIYVSPQVTTLQEKNFFNLEKQKPNSDNDLIAINTR